eukprot:6177493-Pleurochrysis_carterae.AAC.4
MASSSASFAVQLEQGTGNQICGHVGYHCCADLPLWYEFEEAKRYTFTCCTLFLVCETGKAGAACRINGILSAMASN